MKSNSIVTRGMIFLLAGLLLILTLFVGFVLNTSFSEMKASSDDLLHVIGGDIDHQLSAGDLILERLIYKNLDYELLQSENEMTRYYALIALKQQLNTSLLLAKSLDAAVIADGKYDQVVDRENIEMTLEEREAICQYTLEYAKKRHDKATWKSVVLQERRYVVKVYVWRQQATAVFIDVEHLMEIIAGQPEAMTLVLCDREHRVIESLGKKKEEYQQDQILTIGHMDVSKSYVIRDEQMELCYIQNIFSIADRIGIIALVVIAILTITVFLTIHILNAAVHEQLRDIHNQTQLQEAELRSIRLQIRPHFFLNALNTITSLSIQGKNQEIQEYISLLSVNIRYMFRAGIHTVPLSKEMRHAEEFVRMQEIRYPGLVFYSAEVEDEVTNWPIPQMIIHTILENDYKYAVSPDSLLMILVKAERIDEGGRPMLLLTIEDDGPGFPQEVLGYFEKKELKEPADGHHIGLYSMAKMMQLLYGREDLFTVSNNEIHGSRVRFKIPDLTKEDQK